MATHANSSRARAGARQARLAARMEVRRGQRLVFRRYLWQSALATVVPGTGFLMAHRWRRLGLALVALLVLGAVGFLGFSLVQSPRDFVVDLAVSPDRLLALGIALVIAGVAWLLIAAASLRVLAPEDLGLGRRMAGSFVVVLLASVVLAPMALGAQYAFVQRDLISSVFGDEDDQGVSLTRPVIEKPKEDPWKNIPRLNVLLLGGDDGEGRVGTRTDSVIVASIDTTTGDAVLFSLPRNLARTPFPEGPLRDAYPRGFTGSENEAEYFLNAVYGNIPRLHPEVFEGVLNPGAEALKMATGEILGLDVDYYVQINLEGFSRLVDALGGVDVDVTQRLPVGNKQLPDGTCSQPSSWIEKGEQHLNGYQALWYARSRCSTDDYDRMRRQRCVIGALIGQADPITVLRSYQSLAAVTKDIVRTDVSQDLLPAFVDLTLKVKGAGLTSLPFTNRVITSANPNYAKIRALVQEAIAPKATPTPKPTVTASGTGSSTASPKATATATPKASTTPKATERDGAQSLEDVC